jgi:hypothetical protein
VCDTHLTRREALVTAALGVAAAGFFLGDRTAAAMPTLAAVPAVTVADGLAIMPRDAWGADLAPKGPIAAEDVRFLLVHHTASSNTYAKATDVIRETYAWQTSPAKGWNDVCYEFFIGRDGDVWEGRAGALAGPVVADATGGSQGFAQLVCLLGTFTDVAPTQAAQDALVKVLAWLAMRDGVDLSAGASTSFTSRGSQRWPAGTEVVTPTIAGHRDMSYTECPGDLLYDLLPDIRSRADVQLASYVTGLKPARRLGPTGP